MFGAEATAIQIANPNTRWVDTDSHGYGILTVTRQAAQMDWHFLMDKAVRSTAQFHAQSWRVRSGARTLAKVAHPITE